LQPEIPRFQFDGLFVDRVVLETVPFAQREDGEEKPSQVLCDLGPSGQLIVNAELRRAELTLNMDVTPDPKWQPYKISVRVIGQFSQIVGDLKQFQQFLRISAPAILFPYVREIIDRLTADAKYGKIRLNPVNLQSLISWGDEENLSTATEPPALQSPSASPESEPEP
jgi:preprotein translocase subunit SecB